MTTTPKPEANGCSKVDGLARLIGKPMFFSLTNGWAKFYQVDRHRKAGEMQGEF
jgi:hypothetical protein